MGQDKALLQVAGRSLLELALDKLRSIGVAAPRIAAARTDLSSHAPVVPDLHPGCGPLSGIEAALAASSQPLNLFLPVDMPLLPARFLNWMLLRAEITGALVTVPRINGLAPAPLCCLPPGSAASHHRVAACRQLQSHARGHRGRQANPRRSMSSIQNDWPRPIRNCSAFLLCLCTAGSTTATA